MPRRFWPWLVVLVLAATGAGPDRPPVLEGGDRRPTPRWVSVMPSGAAWVSSVGIDSGSQLYVATDAGIFRSPDGGATWTVPNATIESLREVQRFVFDPTEPSTVYGITLSGVLKSTDRGESWRSLGGSAGSLSYVTALALDPSSPQILYAGSGSALFKSTNGGAAWTRLDLGAQWPATIESIVVDPSSNATVYVGTDYFAFKSTNGGSDWRMLGREIYVPTGQPINVMAVALDPRSPATVYAATGCTVGFEGPPCGDGVYRSEDGGSSWIALHGGMGPYTPVWALVFLPGSGILYAGTYYGVFQLRAGGRSWLPVNEGLQDSDVHALAYAEFTDSLFAVSRYRLFRLPAASRLAPDRAPRRLLYR